MDDAKRLRFVAIRAVAIAASIVLQAADGARPWAAEVAQVSLLTDADRDGTLSERDAAARKAGGHAVMMANRDDDDGDGRADADDELVNGSADVHDLVPLAITVPAETRRIRVSAGAAPVRWHQRTGAGDWRHLGLREAEVSLEDADSRPDRTLTLHLESCAWAGMPAAWDGCATIVVTAVDATGRTLASDDVRYDVAPVVISPATARVKEVFAARGLYENDAFLHHLGGVLAKADVPLTIHPAVEWREMWMQDTMEIGSAAIPGSRMYVVLAGLRSADRFPPTLLGPDTAVAVVAKPRQLAGGDAWADWYGNLESSPPTAAHLDGRVIHGRNVRTGTSFHPEVIAFLAAQGIQPPVWIDTSWLLIKHVDEIVTFLPGADGHCVILVPDPEAGLSMLDDQAGEAVTRRRREAAARIHRTLEAMLFGGPAPPRAGVSVATARDGSDQVGLLDLLGLDRGRVVRLPVAFDVPERGLPADGGVTDASTLWSNPINALVVNGTVICGASGMPDAAKTACRERFLAAGANCVEFIDDTAYQTHRGNVHCATNARRNGREDRTAIPD
jgi:protein-arginine deiminase